MHVDTRERPTPTHRAGAQPPKHRAERPVDSLSTARVWVAGWPLPMTGPTHRADR